MIEAAVGELSFAPMFGMIVGGPSTRAIKAGADALVRLGPPLLSADQMRAEVLDGTG